LGSSLLRRPLGLSLVLLEPPHTLARLSAAAGLDERDTQRIRRLFGIIEDFWLTVPAIEGARAPHGFMAQPPILYAKRVKTRGKPVLLQTIAWLEKYGFHNPIVWCEVE